MNKILVILSLLIMAAACAAPPTNQPAPSSNTNAAETTSTAMMSEADAIAKEKATWATIEKKDYDAFGNMLTSDYIEVGDDGTYDKAGIIAELKDFTIADPSFSDWKLMAIDKDAALLMYNVTFKGTFKGQEVPPGPYRASSVWVNRDGKWLAAYYQQTLAKTSPMPAMPANTPAAKGSASLAKTPEASTGADLVANEKMVWDALKRKDYDGFAAFLDDAQIEVETDGVYDKAGTLKNVRMFDASKSEQSDFKTVKFDSDASLVTYVVKSADPKVAKSRDSTIWVNRGGKWLALFHQGTPESPASAMPASKMSPSPSPKASPSPRASATPAAKASPVMKASPKTN